MMSRKDLLETCEGILWSVIDRAGKTQENLSKLAVLDSSSASCISLRRGSIRMNLKLKEIVTLQEKIDSYSAALLVVISMINV